MTQQQLREAAQQFEQGNFEAAAELSQQLIDQDPENGTAYHIRGLCDFSRGRPTEAVGFLREAAARITNNPPLFLVLGICEAQSGVFEAAKTAFENAIILQPDMVDAHFNLGVAFREQQKFDEAERAFRAALEIDTNHIGSMEGLGFVLQSRGQLPAAIEQFKAILLMDPNHLNSLVNLGVALDKNGDYEAALEQLQKAHAQAPDDWRIWVNLGSIYRHLDRIEEGIDADMQAHKLVPQLATIPARIAGTFEETGEMEKAREWCEITLALDPKNELAMALAARLQDAGGG